MIVPFGGSTSRASTNTATRRMLCPLPGIPWSLNEKAFQSYLRRLISKVRVVPALPVTWM